MAQRPALPPVIHASVRFVARLLIGALVVVELLEEVAVIGRRMRGSMNSAWDRANRHERTRTFSEEIRWLVRLQGERGRSLSTESSSPAVLANSGGER